MKLEVVLAIRHTRCKAYVARRQRERHALHVGFDDVLREIGLVPHAGFDALDAAGRGANCGNTGRPRRAVNP